MNASSRFAPRGRTARIFPTPRGGAAFARSQEPHLRHRGALPSFDEHEIIPPEQFREAAGMKAREPLARPVEKNVGPGPEHAVAVFPAAIHVHAVNIMLHDRDRESLSPEPPRRRLDQRRLA